MKLDSVFAVVHSGKGWSGGGLGLFDDIVRYEDTHQGVGEVETEDEEEEKEEEREGREKFG